jgi:transposase InsO family protein
MRFRFIEDHRADYPVTVLCDVLGVSPAGYYAWRSRPESRRSAANRHLIDDIRRVHRDTHGRYGSPRIHVELKAQGRGVSRGRIERLMRHHGIRAIMAQPRRVPTTDSRHDFPIAPNLLDRNFTAAAPNRIWLADNTYIETDQGWLYLATVLDLYSRRIDHLRADLPLAAFADGHLGAAAGRRLDPPFRSGRSRRIQTRNTKCVHSRQQLVKRLCRRFPAQGLSRSGIEGRCHGGDLIGAMNAQVSAFREVLTQ